MSAWGTSKCKRDGTAEVLLYVPESGSRAVSTASDIMLVSQYAFPNRVIACTVHYMHSYTTEQKTLAGNLSSKKVCTYFPPFTGSMPKLDPTTPVQVQFSSAAFVHLAVAVAPTFRHVIDADAGDKTRTARVMVKRANMITVELGSAYINWKKAKNSRHNHLLYIYSVHSATAMALIRRSDLGICCSLG